MALFDTTAAESVPRLPSSRRYSLALAHETGKVSRPGDKARRLPPRRKGDPSGEAFDESRMRPSIKGEASPFLADRNAHRAASDTAKNPITGDPLPVEATPGKSVAGFGDYPRDYSTAEPSAETVAVLDKRAADAEKIAASRAVFNAERAAAEDRRKKRYGW